ncbi:cysteine synthase A [Enterococcus aquimarinus]|uniref:Cysteine synthase n=2 Tax=Enterococcus aquimarinus TaxID=328396 RepID=A0A1L8QW52_9ENTE|nr:cysteine synthase A [Enterococcus aquimarinus]OJG11732.1 Cysteine synthase [Enterococcus aquimarinus]
MLYQNIIETIGSTPLVKINHLDPESAGIYVKLESFNPGGSTKDRPALYMIQAAEKAGLIKKGDTLIEATSGNMGIALSMIGAALGYKIVIVMPDTMSEERRRIVKAYGAELILTEGKLGMAGAVAKSEELAKAHDYFLIRQFENAANLLSHEETTAVEILHDLSGEVDAFVAGVGTGGTISGVGKVLKAHHSNVLNVAVQPAKSPVLTGGTPAGHGIQGIGANFIPGIYDKDVVDEVLDMDEETAYAAARELGKKAGLLVGMSSGGNFAAAKIIAKKLGKGKKVVTVLPDTGERYLSTILFAEE